MIKIYNDDCFNVFPNLKKNSIDLVVVDLPYGQTACAWDKKIDLEKMWIELKRIAKENTAFIFFTTTKFGNDLMNSNMKWFRYDIVWIKKNTVGFLLANKMPLRKHEMIYIFYKKLPTYNPQKTFGHKPYIQNNEKKMKEKACYGKLEIKHSGCDSDGSRHPVSYIEIGEIFNQHNQSLHPTQKPIALLEWLIESYSNEDDTVLDFTMGCGTTGLACKNKNRNFIGIEMNKDFYDKCLVKEEL